MSTDDRITLSDDPVEALRRIGNYLRTVNKGPSYAIREIDEFDLRIGASSKNDPRIIGYYQLTPWINGLLDIAAECDRIRGLGPYGIHTGGTSDSKMPAVPADEKLDASSRSYLYLKGYRDGLGDSNSGQPDYERGYSEGKRARIAALAAYAAKAGDESSQPQSADGEAK